MPEECGSTEHIGNPEVLGSTHWLSAKPEHMILKHMIGKLAACFLPPTEHTPMPSLAFVGLFSLSHYLSLSLPLSLALYLSLLIMSLALLLSVVMALSSSLPKSEFAASSPAM